MSNHKERGITRIALLQDYQARPEKLLDLLEEVAAKGYHGVDTWVDFGNMEFARRFSERAHSLGLSVGFATCYMINQFKHISQFPEQRFVEAVPGLDIDGLGTGSWGCPFNPDFKNRYLDQLRIMASYPGAARILVNDEASMSNGCYCSGCLAEYDRQFGGEPPRLKNIGVENWSDRRWREFLKWRIERWNNVHGEMTDVIHQINPRILVGFQTSPAVDLWKNPWSSAVDLHGMAHQLDLISVDPYYTSHCAPCFQPAEVYLSEWCRFLKGIVPKDKYTEVVTQGFSHPNFTRPMNESDGCWAALVPAACGIDFIMAYSYTLQRCSPMQKAYESCFDFDPYFRRVQPLKYGALVHGLQTEIFAHPLPRDVPGSFDGTRLFPVAESLRHHGIPYLYFPDGNLDDYKSLQNYKVVILPEIECLSDGQCDCLRNFAANGGNLVILGDLGVADEIGSPRKRSLLEELTGIKIANRDGKERYVIFKTDLDCACDIQTVDDHSVTYWQGVYKPVCCLRYCVVPASLPSNARILAHFTDDNCNDSGPAVVALQRQGSILWFAGIPSRSTVNPKLGSEVLNESYHWFAALTENAAGVRPSIRVENWPPMVPIRELRPTDRRNMSTFDFFPMAGEDISLALITSYFREPARFPLLFDVPAGKQITAMRELLENRSVDFSCDGGTARIDVQLGFDTPVKLYLFETGPSEK